jgi:hypothetical protein
VAATDPCNLLGSVLPGVKVPRVVGSRVLYRDGVPVATQRRDESNGSNRCLQPRKPPQGIC